MLANVYLHYVLDLWFEKCIKPQLKGEAYLIRYADDFIIMCQYENEAHAIFEALKEGLAKFGLETADDKTKIMPFGRNSTTKDTFDFLGFTHVNSKTRNGKYTVGHKVSKKKKKQFKANLKKWVREQKHGVYDIHVKAESEADWDKQLLQCQRIDIGSQRIVYPCILGGLQMDEQKEPEEKLYLR